MKTESTLTIRYAETDQMGVVYHANYLVWFEIGRTDFLNALGYPYLLFEEQGIISPVLTIECTYGNPLRYGDTVLIHTKVVEVSGTKTTFYYEVYRKGQDTSKEKPFCTGKSSHCLVEKATFKPLSMKKVTPDLYQAYLEALEPFSPAP